MLNIHNVKDNEIFINYEDCKATDFWQYQLTHLENIKAELETDIQKKSSETKTELTKQVEIYRNRPWYSRWAYWLFTDIEARGQVLAKFTILGYINECIFHIKQADTKEFPLSWEMANHDFSERQKYYLSFLSSEHATFFLKLFKNLHYYWISAKQYFLSKGHTNNTYQYNPIVQQTKKLLKSNATSIPQEQKSDTLQIAIEKTDVHHLSSSLYTALGISSNNKKSFSLQEIETALNSLSSTLSQLRQRISKLNKCKYKIIRETNFKNDFVKLFDTYNWLMDILIQFQNKFILLKESNDGKEFISKNEEIDNSSLYYTTLHSRIDDNIQKLGNLCDNLEMYYQTTISYYRTVHEFKHTHEEFQLFHTECKEGALLNCHLAEKIASFCGLADITLDTNKNNWVITLNELKDARSTYIEKFRDFFSKMAI
ncbi:MAG: hypothetical protein M1365_05420, partial [Actinobacteria bacterium]|nr:hypothetical protein [Actinomycetota bacterium]